MQRRRRRPGVRGDQSGLRRLFLSVLDQLLLNNWTAETSHRPSRGLERLLEEWTLFFFKEFSFPLLNRSIMSEGGGRVLRHFTAEEEAVSLSFCLVLKNVIFHKQKSRWHRGSREIHPDSLCHSTYSVFHFIPRRWNKNTLKSSELIYSRVAAEMWKGVTTKTAWWDHRNWVWNNSSGVWKLASRVKNRKWWDIVQKKKKRLQGRFHRRKNVLEQERRKKLRAGLSTSIFNVSNFLTSCHSRASLCSFVS